MGLKHSKAEKMPTEVDEKTESEDESEILDIFQSEVFDTEECEEEIQEAWYGHCKKKASHHNEFISINDLQLEDLPEPIRHESLLYYVQLRAQLVVRIIVRATSNARPDNCPFKKSRGKRLLRVATGYAWICSEDQSPMECPKKPCDVKLKESGGKETGHHFVYRGILITTNQHVIFNNEEAKEAEVQFFYDSVKDKKSTVTVSGFGYLLREDLGKKDYVSLRIYCHDESLFQRICHINEEIMKTWEEMTDDLKSEFEKYAIAISHPHGHYKMVSIGNVLQREVREEESGRKATMYTCVTCSGSSGAPILTGVYWTNPFVHSSSLLYRKENNKKKSYFGISYSY